MQHYPNTRALACDFKDDESLSNLCGKLVEWNLDVLINNAYTPLETKHFHKIELDVFKNNFMHNILPVVRITQQAIMQFRKKKFGKIINITTAYTVNKPPTGLSAYAAEKSYITSLSKAWAAENASFNITSNCVAPGMMQTELTAHMDARVIEQAIAAHPLKRLLTPEETAETVFFLAQAPQHVNGTTLIVNGGADVI